MVFGPSGVVGMVSHDKTPHESWTRRLHLTIVIGGSSNHGIRRIVDTMHCRPRDQNSRVFCFKI